MKTIILPNRLMNPVFVKGLRQALESVAEILDSQGQPYHALSFRDAATICDTFVEVNITKTAELHNPK